MRSLRKRKLFGALLLVGFVVALVTTSGLVKLHDEILKTSFEQRDQAIMRQWQMRIERAEYEAALAERRYQECDPSNRLVAGTLERRWNEALLRVEQHKIEAAQFALQKTLVATQEQRAKVLALARDFPRLWRAPTTQAKDRKRMLRLLILDITVEKLADRRQLVLHVRWQGGACTDVAVNLPPPIAEAIRTPVATVDVTNLFKKADATKQISMMPSADLLPPPVPMPPTPNDQVGGQQMNSSLLAPKPLHEIELWSGSKKDILSVPNS